LPDARLPGRRAQEVRPQEGPRELPVLQALSLLGQKISRAASAALCFWVSPAPAPADLDAASIFDTLQFIDYISRMALELEQTETFRLWEQKLRDRRARTLIAARLLRLAE